MEKSRIGGGLLAAVGIAAPWVAQMMGLTVPAPVGWLLLGLCGLAALVGLVLLLWPRKQEHPAHIEEPSVGVKMRGDRNSLDRAEIHGMDTGLELDGTGHRVSNVSITSQRAGAIGVNVRGGVHLSGGRIVSDRPVVFSPPKPPPDEVAD